MPLDDLVSVIETLQQRIRDHGPTLRENETRTRMALIDPLLTALGWDVSDPALVTPEYNVSGRWADYALLRPDGQPAATIEAKKLSESLASHRMQMLNYSNASGVEYAGLTDGDHWELYEVFQRGQLEDRRILDVSIANMPAHELALKLLLLWRPNLASGQPVAAEEPIFTVGATPTSELEPARSAAEPTMSPLANAVSPGDGWVVLSSIIVETGDKSPKAVRFPDGHEHQMRSWIQLVGHTVGWLSSKALLAEGNVPIASSNKRFIVHTEPIHPTGKRFNQRNFITGTPFVIEGNTSSKAAVSNAKKLLSHCGIDPATVHLQVEP